MDDGTEMREFIASESCKKGIKDDVLKSGIFFDILTRTKFYLKNVSMETNLYCELKQQEKYALNVGGDKVSRNLIAFHQQIYSIRWIMRKRRYFEIKLWLLACYTTAVYNEKNQIT